MPGTSNYTKFIYDEIKTIGVYYKSTSTQTASNNDPKFSSSGETSSNYSKKVTLEFKGIWVGAYLLGGQLATQTYTASGGESSSSTYYSHESSTNTRIVYCYRQIEIGTYRRDGGDWGYKHAAGYENLGMRGWLSLEINSNSTSTKSFKGEEIANEFGGGSVPGYSYTSTSTHNLITTITILGDSPSPSPTPSPSPSPTPTPDPDCDCDYNAIAREMRSKHADLFALIKR